jgi:hypothetical protein
MRLWIEALENRYFPCGTRILILETRLHFFYVQYTLIIQGKIHSGVTQKKPKPNGCLTFVSRKKLQRFVFTLATQLTGFLLEEPDLGLDRIGSHTEENFIGSVRAICHGDNRLDNVQHQVPRVEFARSQLSVLGIKRKIAKGVNLGGISIARSGGFEMVLEGTWASFAAELLNFSGTKDWVICGGAPESHRSSGFIDQIWKRMDLAPLDARSSRV